MEPLSRFTGGFSLLYAVDSAIHKSERGEKALAPSRQPGAQRADPPPPDGPFLGKDPHLLCGPPGSGPTVRVGPCRPRRGKRRPGGDPFAEPLVRRTAVCRCPDRGGPCPPQPPVRRAGTPDHPPGRIPPVPPLRRRVRGNGGRPPPGTARRARSSPGRSRRGGE